MRTQVVIIGAGPAGLPSDLRRTLGAGLSLRLAGRPRGRGPVDRRAGLRPAPHGLRYALDALGRVSWFYLQVAPEEDAASWSEDRAWDALSTRLGEGIDGWTLGTGPITEQSVLPMRSLVTTSPALAEFCSADALRRVWRCTPFSWRMTSMLHVTGDPFGLQLQLSQLRWVTSSPAGAAGLAENYAGLPIGF